MSTTEKDDCKHEFVYEFNECVCINCGLEKDPIITRKREFLCEKERP